VISKSQPILFLAGLFFGPALIIFLGIDLAASGWIGIFGLSEKYSDLFRSDWFLAGSLASALIIVSIAAFYLMR
jgi:hypothetical protein